MPGVPGLSWECGGRWSLSRTTVWREVHCVSFAPVYSHSLVGATGWSPSFDWRVLMKQTSSAPPSSVYSQVKGPPNLAEIFFVPAKDLFPGFAYRFLPIAWTIHGEEAVAGIVVHVELIGLAVFPQFPFNLLHRLG